MQKCRSGQSEYRSFNFVWDRWAGYASIHVNIWMFDIFWTHSCIYVYVGILCVCASSFLIFVIGRRAYGGMAYLLLFIQFFGCRNRRACGPYGNRNSKTSAMPRHSHAPAECERSPYQYRRAIKFIKKGNNLAVFIPNLQFLHLSKSVGVFVN